MVAVLVPVVLGLPKSWPLVPPKSMVPSNAEAGKLLFADALETRPGMPVPDSVSVPDTVGTMVDEPPSRLSTLIELVKVLEFTTSIDVSVPSDGSNCDTLTDCVQSVEVVGIV